MVKNAKTIIVTLLTIILFTNFTAHPTSITTTSDPAAMLTIQKAISKTSEQFVTYTWYKDEELTEMTGTFCDINIEINRLNVLFPGYIFSSYHISGTYAYEYGYHGFFPTVIIYSNLL